MFWKKVCARSFMRMELVLSNFLTDERSVKLFVFFFFKKNLKLGLSNNSYTVGTRQMTFVQQKSHFESKSKVRLRQNAMLRSKTSFLSFVRWIYCILLWKNLFSTLQCPFLCVWVCVYSNPNALHVTKKKLAINPQT